MKNKQHETTNHNFISKVMPRVFTQLTLTLHCPVTHCCDMFKAMDFTISLQQGLQLSAVRRKSSHRTRNKEPVAEFYNHWLAGFSGIPEVAKDHCFLLKNKICKITGEWLLFSRKFFYAHSNRYTKGVFTAFLWDLATAALLVLTKVIKRLHKKTREKQSLICGLKH